MTGAPAAPGRGRRLGAALSAGVLLVVLAVGGWYVWTRRVEVGAALADIGVAAALGCLALTLLGVLATGECWRVWLSSLADAPARPTSHRVFYLTQSGKYLPGSLWPFLAQALLARRFGVPRSAMVAATTLFLLTHVLTGVVVGVAGAGPQVASAWGWLLYPAAGAGGVLLAPPVLARVLRLADGLRTRLRGRADPAPGPGAPSPVPSWSTVGAAVLLMLAAWASYGTATYLLVRQLSPGPGALPLTLGAYALAWVVGFLAVAAPAGVGAREAVLVLVLAPVLGPPSALAVALVSRVALTLVDLALAAASSGLLRGQGPAADAGPAGNGPAGAGPAEGSAAPAG